MGAPAAIAQALIERDCRALGVAQVEIEHGEPQFAGEPTRSPGRCRARGRRPRAQGATKALVSVPANACASLLRGARLSCAEPAMMPSRRPTTSRRSGTSSTPSPIIFQHLARRRLQPAKPAALGDGALGRLAEIVEISAGKSGSAARQRSFAADSAHRSWMPPQKVADKPQPRLLALLGMELRSGKIVASDRSPRAARRNRSIATRSAGVGEPQMVAVHKIGMRARRSSPTSNGCAAASFESRSSPYAGSLRSGSRGSIATTSPPIQPRPSIVSNSRPRSAISCMPTQMPRNGRPRTNHCLLRAPLRGRGRRRGPRRQSAKAPTPGRTMRSAAATHLGHARHVDLGRVRRFRRRRARTPSPPSADCPSRNRQSLRSSKAAAEHALGRRHGAGAPGSISTAWRNARARPLKQDSTMWWLFSP